MVGIVASALCRIRSPASVVSMRVQGESMVIATPLLSLEPTGNVHREAMRRSLVEGFIQLHQCMSGILVTRYMTLKLFADGEMTPCTQIAVPPLMVMHATFSLSTILWHPAVSKGD